MSTDKREVIVKKFAKGLIEYMPSEVSLDMVRPPLIVKRGILYTSKLMYSEDPINFLGRELEYRVFFGSEPFEISVQLYKNIHNHYRLFVYCRAGMLVSLNLSLAKVSKGGIELSHVMSIRSRDMSTKGREQAKSQMIKTLSKTGVEIDEHGRLFFGTFIPGKGFLETNVRSFIRRLLAVALIKGHFMGNKGYSLKNLKAVSMDALSKMASNRNIPLGLRYEVLKRDRYKCRACGKSAKDGVVLHIDHIVPVSKGGLTIRKNLKTLCLECNIGKSNK